jgi:protein TonB
VVEAPKPAPRAKRAEPQPQAAPEPVAASNPAPTFGIAMTGGVGLGGIAVPVGDSLAAPREEQPKKRVAEAKSLIEPAKKQVAESACTEPASKPKPLQMSRPEYTEQARAAGIEGKVRVELTVDASGAVRNVRVLESLGYGLDEAAIAAVQAASFEPAQACGKPVEATFVVSIRFAL